MKSGKRQSPKDILASHRFAKDENLIRSKLQRWIVHTRDVANGKDFLFSGPESQIRSHLKSLIAEEKMRSSDLTLTYVHLDEYVLLRITGPPSSQSTIDKYFE